MDTPTHFDSSQLCLFTGTTHYHRISRRYLLTDGAKYLADAAGTYWLMDADASDVDKIGKQNCFVLNKLLVQQSRAAMIYEDGNGNEHARQEIA